MNDTARSDVGFLLVTSVLILMSHAAAFFAHEFAHSVLAWSLGFMKNPLALDYGSASPGNILLQIEVGENVDYDQLLANGHGLAAATIALAGAFIGNGVLYGVAYAALKSGAAKAPRPVASFLFWFSLMCAGNVWSYVPLRALASHADIATAAKGLGLPSLALLPILLVPALFITLHFFRRTCRMMIPIMTAGHPVRAMMVIALVGAWFFIFFGGAGFSGNYGAIAQAMSIVSELLLFPFSIIWLSRGTMKSLP